ncbi:protein DD3-3-like [Mercenaria mercenaria]|uniref:protein DD3-3-like n=1 Tax=Mercenaria mercenaria TaxID=6596 RepID=UPI00234EC3C0|nr:protein DD3-3-like [Mercenaria mercenaria]
MGKAIFLLVTLTIVSADIYFDNPRGSNNRLNENTRNRKNANRLFDSQNNNRGGYNVGPQPMYYYAGSKLQIEWTNQHSCSDKNNHCELIIQYMCGKDLRDGTSTDTIPLQKTNCANNNCNTDKKYGMHEDYDYYRQCRLRQRNKGLFTADQNMGNRETAVSTRQENNGKNNRYGYECTEERDYYPYWHPSPWKDIAVLTNDIERCKYYMTESANVKSRWQCVFPTVKLEEMDGKVKSIPNNKEDCENFRYPANDKKGIKGVWKEIPAHGLPAPVCRETQFTRDNHLGNGLDGNPNRYNWTLPDISEDKCVLRIRYNISTNDYDGWNTNVSMNAAKINNPTKLDLSEKYGFNNYTDAENRGYVFKGDPEVKIFEEGTFNFRLAIDTSQFGRTFQDRSHVFSIKKTPNNLKGVTVHNVNVRGKRGNIVQVYPAVEYDFVPNTLEMGPGEYVHFQWTGSDTNPLNNDGQGKQGSDRNNVLLLRDQNYPEGNGVQYGPAPTYGHYGNNYPMRLNESDFLGLNIQDLTKLAFLDPGNVGPNLDEASPYFDLGPRKVTQLGTYHYVSTRNNDFTNRDQKGRIMVTNMAFTESALGFFGGNIALPNGAGTVHVNQGVFDGLHMIRLEVWPRSQGHEKVRVAGKVLKAGDDYVSDFLVLYPQLSIANPGKHMDVTLKVDPDANRVAVYRTSSESNFGTWTKLDTEVDGDVASFKATAGGVYVAKSHSDTVLIVALVVSALVILALVVGGICYFKKNPNKWKKLKTDAKNVKRNFNEEL